MGRERTVPSADSAHSQLSPAKPEAQLHIIETVTAPKIEVSYSRHWPPLRQWACVAHGSSGAGGGGGATYGGGGGATYGGGGGATYGAGGGGAEPPPQLHPQTSRTVTSSDSHACRLKSQTSPVKLGVVGMAAMAPAQSMPTAPSSAPPSSSVQAPPPVEPPHPPQLSSQMSPTVTCRTGEGQARDQQLSMAARPTQLAPEEESGHSTCTSPAGVDAVRCRAIALTAWDGPEKGWRRRRRTGPGSRSVPARRAGAAAPAAGAGQRGGRTAQERRRGNATTRCSWRAAGSRKGRRRRTHIVRQPHSEVEIADLAREAAYGRDGGHGASAVHAHGSFQSAGSVVAACGLQLARERHGGRSQQARGGDDAHHLALSLSDRSVHCR